MELTPSPCITASCETSVHRILHLISEKKTTYVLLEGGSGMVSGIITHSDMARIALEIRRNPKVADEPIHKFMTRPVKRLDLSDIQVAPAFMLKNSIHHVPVVENLNKDDESIIGMISSNGIFEEMVRKQSDIDAGIEENQTAQKHLVISPDGSLFRLLKTYYKDSRKHFIDRVRLSQFRGQWYEEDDVTNILLDIDDLKSRQWLSVVKEAMTYFPTKKLFLIFTPNEAEPVYSKIYSLEKSGQIKVFEKPLDISQLTQTLNT